MKVTNREIYDAREPLGELMAKEIPLKVAYRVLQLTDIFDRQLKLTEVIRKKLITKYGEPDPTNPSNFFVSPSSKKHPMFSEEITELMEMAIEIDFKAVKLPEALQISPLSLKALNRFIRV